MAIFDFSSDVNNIDFTKYGIWQAISCPIGVPQFAAPVEPVGPCNENTIYNYNGTCYQCVSIQNASPTKLMINNVIRWAKMTLSFDENTGSSVSNKTVYYKRPYGTLPNTSKTGHTFNGWFTDETWGTEVTEETICNQVDNHTLYAKLDINYYTITYLDYAGNFVADYSIGYGTTPPIPTGTLDTAQYDYSWPTVGPATADVTYQETRTVKSYVVTWYKYGKSGEDYAKRETIPYGGISIAPSGTGDTAQYDYSWPKASTTVTGAETIIETRALKYYTVIWKDWDGSTLKTQSVAYGSDGTPPTQPTRTGYTFNGWSGTYTNITSNRTITATYNINYYTVTFKDYDGTTLKTQSVAYGSNATPPADPTRTGYTFNSWSGTYTNITSSRTITATYNINYYAVTWKDWDNTTLKTEMVAYGGDSTPPIQPTRTGYDFVSWTGSYLNVTSNRTITAKYTVKTYVLSISSITGIASQTVTRTSSPNGGGSIGTLVNSALLYYGDVLTISATASNGYNASVSGSPVTVGGNIATNNYITVSYDPSQPIITYTGKTGFSMSFTVKNQNSQYNVRIYYKAGSAPTTSSYDGYVDVGANATSPTQNLDGLIPSTNYNIYARAYKEGSYSPSVYFNQTTNNLTAPSTWYDYSTTSNSITMRVYNPNPVSVTLYYAANQNPPTANSITVPAQSYAYATVSGLSANTTYTIYGRFGYSGKYSSTVSDSAKTNTAVKTWVYITYATSDPAIAPEVYSANATVHTAASILETFYPAANRTVGTFGAVESGGSWFICEVQLV